MAWNHRSAVLSIAIAIQPTPGVFNAPNTTTDVMAAANVSNTSEAIKAPDPTATGTIWKARDATVGEKSTVGGTLPLRGPGGGAPFAANGWVPGRVAQACGFAEVILGAAVATVLGAGQTTTSLTLNATESASDGFLTGAPIQQAAVGAGFKATTLIRSYVGATKVAQLAETLAAAPADAAAYTIPAHVRYVLGTLVAAPPLLSISVYRDKKRYDYRDWRPSTWKIDIPVSNDANTTFPSIEFSGSGIKVAVADDVTPPVPSAVLAVQIPPARNGKFYLDKVKLGHQQLSFGISAEVGAPSNQNQAAGQDGYEHLSGTRQVDLDLNQMNVADFDIETRTGAQTVLPVMSTWGIGAGNNMGFIVPNIVLDPLNPGERNGFVSLTGSAEPTDFDKSAAFSIWW